MIPTTRVIYGYFSFVYLSSGGPTQVLMFIWQALADWAIAPTPRELFLNKKVDAYYSNPSTTFLEQSQIVRSSCPTYNTL